MTATSLSGGCLCGAVRYQSAATPVFSLQCYCRQCQKITGTGHASQFALPVSEVEITGRLAEYRLQADSGNSVASCFCPACGSPVFKKTSGVPQFVFFHVATLDEPGVFQPQRAVWTSSRPRWDMLDPALPADP